MDNKKEQSKRDNVQEITGVLHGQKKKLDEIEQDLQDQHQEGMKKDKKLDDLLAQTEKLCDEVGVTMPSESQSRKDNLIVVDDSSDALPVFSWDNLLEEYEPIYGDKIVLDDLLSPETIVRIDAKFDAPIARLKWDRLDYLACFCASLVGIITDLFCSEIDNPISKKLTEYGTKAHDSGSYYKSFKKFQKWINKNPVASKFEWMNKLSEVKIDHNNLPIDYRGKGYKGPYHRVLSGGHDLLRFMSAIWQIKNGQFHGVRPLKSGGAIINIVDISSSGKPYTPTPDLMTAIINYLLHIASDALTATSLPVPGATLFREMSGNHDFRVFIVKSYTRGYNLRHVISQGVTPAVTGLVIWLYYTIRYKIPMLYKKWRKISFEEENVPGLKLAEMYTLSHGLVAAINVGKVVIRENPLLLNLPQLLVFLKSTLTLSLKSFKRYNYQARFERNKLYIDDGWNQLDLLVNKPPDVALEYWPQKVIELT